MASSSPSTSSTSLPSPHPRSSIFTPIPENEREEEEEVEEQQQSLPKVQPALTDDFDTYKHKPTPLHPSTASLSPAVATTRSNASKKQSSRSNGGSKVDAGDNDDLSVSCNKCRPSARDKISIVPLDINSRRHPSSSCSPSNPNGLLRSLFFSLTRRSPATTTASYVTSGVASQAREADEWRHAAAELSRKLLQTTRKRDEALLEASRLKYSLVELESKVGRLESHCRDLKAALDRCCSSGPTAAGPPTIVPPFPLEAFVRAVEDARTAVRHLGLSLTAQIRLAPTGSRSADRVAALIHPYDPRAAAQWRRNPAAGGLLFYMEALLNGVFYSRFELEDDDEASSVDPAVRCEKNRDCYEAVRELGWDEVLGKGTRHFSEGLSRFCDRKMSQVAQMVGWARAWPEGLLQALFGAAKGAWVVRLMARSVHPAVPPLRVDRAARFDVRFMEDIAADRVRRLAPVAVRVMVAPGFHVYNSGPSGVVKCKVLCVYNSSSNCGNVNVSQSTSIAAGDNNVNSVNSRNSNEGFKQ